MVSVSENILLLLRYVCFESAHSSDYEVWCEFRGNLPPASASFLHDLHFGTENGGGMFLKCWFLSQVHVIRTKKVTLLCS
jgi:hypothetical protein